MAAAQQMKNTSCGRCGKTVYDAEKVLAGGQVGHCFQFRDISQLGPVSLRDQDKGVSFKIVIQSSLGSGKSEAGETIRIV